MASESEGRGERGAVRAPPFLRHFAPFWYKVRPVDREMTDRERDRSRWLRLSGIGTEFVAAIVGTSLLGVWVDHHWGCSPWGVLIGFGLGSIGATYNLAKQSRRAFGEQRDEKKDDPAE